jgi:hypothetical protein
MSVEIAYMGKKLTTGSLYPKQPTPGVHGYLGDLSWQQKEVRAYAKKLEDINHQRKKKQKLLLIEGGL